jgi:hypothetical protein
LDGWEYGVVLSCDWAFWKLDDVLKKTTLEKKEKLAPKESQRIKDQWIQQWSAAKMATANPFEDPSIEAASKSRVVDESAKPKEKKKKSSIDTMKENGWLPKPAPVSQTDGSLPADWVQMRLANVIGVALMIITGLFNFLGGSSISTVI